MSSTSSDAPFRSANAMNESKRSKHVIFSVEEKMKIDNVAYFRTHTQALGYIPFKIYLNTHVNNYQCKLIKGKEHQMIK